MIPAFILPLLLLAQAAGAQTVTVRSGEHPGFTRIVLTQPAPGAWDFGRSETGYVFRSRGQINAFDISTVYDRIGRQRLAALDGRPADGLLALDLNCDCHAVATPFRPGVIVIDIADGPAPAGSPFEDMLDLPSLWSVARAQIRPPQRPADFATPPKLPTLGPRRPQESSPDLPPLAQRLRIPDVRAELLGERLGRELSRSIASGAITAAPAPAATLTPRSLPVVLPIPAEPIPAIAGPQINTRSPGGTPSREPPPSGISCIVPEDLQLSAWGEPRPASQQIAEARSGILSEFDRPNPEGLRRLTRLYLHLGFGAEAGQLLATWPLDAPETAMLKSLAAMIDGATGGHTFTAMQGCDGPAALWSALSQTDLPPGTDRGAVVRAFSDLPAWLRRELGPRLAEKFIAAGDLSTAQSLEQILSRAQPEGPEAALVGGKVDLARGAHAKAEPQLQSVAETKGPLASTALAALLENKLSRGEAITEAEVSALDTLAREHSGSPDATHLQRILGLSLVATGAADRAFQTIAARQPEFYPAFWAMLAERGSDAEVAQQSLSPPAGSLRGLPQSTSHQLAAKLISVGFPERALTMIESLSGDATDLLRARAHLVLRDGRASLRHLAGAEGTEAASIRAEALEILADYPAAEAAWTEAGNPARASRLRLIRQDWSTPPEELAEIAQAFSDVPQLPPEPLARARAQVSGAAELRAAALRLVRSSRSDAVE